MGLIFMDKLPGIYADINIGAAALAAHTAGVHAAAFNIATISAETPSRLRADLADGPKGAGVYANLISNREESAGGLRELNQVAGADIAKEFTLMIAESRAFEAAAAIVRTADETSGVLINLKA